MEPWIEATIVTVLTAIVVCGILICVFCRLLSKESLEHRLSQSDESKNGKINKELHGKISTLFHGRISTQLHAWY